MPTYAFDNAWQRARKRLTALETWLDPGTIRHLDKRGVAPGWCCLEIGAGGWLVVEEMDFAAAALDPGCGADAVALFDKALAGHHQVMARHGMNPFFGRRLLGALQARDLVAIGTEGSASCCASGSPEAVAWRLTFEQLREELVTMGAMTDDDVSAIIALLGDPATTFLTQVTVAAWGQRPASE